MGSLTLRPDQDGMGYFYGDYRTDAGERLRVNVLPPRSHPRPSYVLVANEEADARQWIIYVNGEEVARVDDRAAIAAALTDALTTP